jgi:hypothetical protein
MEDLEAYLAETESLRARSELMRQLAIDAARVANEMRAEMERILNHRFDLDQIIARRAALEPEYYALLERIKSFREDVKGRSGACDV